MSASGDKNEYWVKRADDRGVIDEFSVSPDATSMRYERWSRGKLQRWTLAQLDKIARWDHLVDLGCGFGDFTALFGTRAKKVTACDLSPAFAAAAQRRLDAIPHPDARVATSDIVSFDDYRDASVVHFGAVLTYLDDADATTVIRRARERLGPGGVVAQRDWCVIGLGKEKTLDKDGKWSIHRSPASYVKLFEQNGFRLVKKRISPYIYGEQMTRDAVRAEWLTAALGWLPQLLWRLGTLHWVDCSATFLYRRDG
jgi:SAM-dependent methyltransferase